jgi:RHS repeat-associated protein
MLGSARAKRGLPGRRLVEPGGSVQAGQTTPCFDADFLPYGQEVDYTSTCGTNYRFEGKERDLETGDDNFGARYYRSNLGRWLSADWSSVPAPVPYANLTNPQTLNLYAMVNDNPATFADLDGHCGAITLPGAPPQSCSDAGIVSPNNIATQGQGQQPQPQKTGDGLQKAPTQQAQQQDKMGQPDRWEGARL